MTLFTDKAPGIMRDLMRDFDLDLDSAAAILGNLGHESGGFKFLQEKKPLVPGSRGGYGWAQWTGPRRVAFEAYCKRNKLDPASDKANYGFLFVELTGSEKAAIPAVKAAKGLYNKVVAFEAKFERAGVKHYPSRLNYAQQALKAFGSSVPAPVPSNPVLRKGDGIKDDGFRSVVMEAQRLLTDAGFSLVVDGKFGLVTEAKVIAFQKVRGLVPDGIIGPKTWAELRRIAAEPLSTVAVMGIGEPETEPQPKETTMSIVSGKQKAWMALVMPAVVTAVITGLDMFGVKIDPTIQTGAIMILTALGVYQVPNKGA